jgi:hypothetical protein
VTPQTASMLPDPATPLRFAAGRIVLLLRVPTTADQVALDRAWRAAGGRRWTVWQLIDAMAAGVRAVLPDADDPDRARHLALLVDHRDRLVALTEEVRTLDPADRTDAGRAALAAWSGRWMEALSDEDVAVLEETVARHVPAYRARLADNETADTLRGLVAARMLVVGWEGIDGAPRRSLDGLDEASLARIPRTLLPGLAAFVNDASRVPEGAEKN